MVPGRFGLSGLGFNSGGGVDGTGFLGAGVAGAGIESGDLGLSWEGTGAGGCGGTVIGAAAWTLW